MKPLGELFLERKQSRRLGVDVREASMKRRGREARPHPRGPLVAPLTYFFLLYIPTYPQTIRYGAKKANSTAATFCTREIPSWGLIRSSVGGGIDHGGPLHQLHGLSDDV